MSTQPTQQRGQVPVMFSQPCVEIMAQARIRMERVLATLSNPDDTLPGTGSRVVRSRQFSDGAVILADAVLDDFGGRSVLLVNLAIEVDERTPQPSCKAVFERVAECYGLGLVNKATGAPPAKIFSGPLKGLELAEAPPATPRVHLGSFNPEANLCELVWVLDAHRYLNARVGPPDTGIGIFITPMFQGIITRRDLLAAETMTIVFEMAKTTRHGRAFQMLAEGFEFELHVSETRLSLTRNGITAAISTPPDGSRIIVTWTPTKIFVGMKGEECELETPPTIPPYSLVQWARENDVLPVRFYQSPMAVFDEVLSALQGLEDKIHTVAMQSAFWDAQRKGKGQEKRLPKREPEVHAALHGLLFDIGTAKNLHIQPESPLGGGRLDFLISGTLLNGRLAGVCIEFKNAHSDDLEHGLLTQLPHYMKSKGSDLGIYCVLSYRGRDFDQPKKTPAEIQMELLAASAKAGLKVRILVLDVGKALPPSKA